MKIGSLEFDVATSPIKSAQWLMQLTAVSGLRSFNLF